MESDAEHEQDDADLGELIGDARIGYEAGREGADGDAGQQVANERRQAQAMGRDAKRQGEHKANNDGGDDWRRMGHGPWKFEMCSEL